MASRVAGGCRRVEWQRTWRALARRRAVQSGRTRSRHWQLRGAWVRM